MPGNQNNPFDLLYGNIAFIETASAISLKYAWVNWALLFASAPEDLIIHSALTATQQNRYFSYLFLQILRTET